MLTLAADAQIRLAKKWESDSTLAAPECVLFDKGNLYVSLVDGGPAETDGKGGVARLDQNGRITGAEWISGLDAPKGLSLWKDKLYVTDISKVVIIDRLFGKIDSNIIVSGAVNLNDISIDERGVIYVTDPGNGNIYKIQDGVSSIAFSGFKRLNGLTTVGKDLWILSNKRVYHSTDGKRPVRIARMKANGDGIEKIAENLFMISCTDGMIYSMKENGEMNMLLDTRKQGISTADIDYDPERKILYVPTLRTRNSVIAFGIEIFNKGQIQNDEPV